jgi:hypothetical protein
LRVELLDERRDAMTKWADWLARTTSPLRLAQGA